MYQIENQLHKNNVSFNSMIEVFPFSILQELLGSLDKNEKLIYDCTEVDMSNLQCLSNEGVKIIQKEIDDIVHDLKELKLSIGKLKIELEGKFVVLQGKHSSEENLKLWLKKEEKKLKLLDKIDGEDAIKDERKRLQVISSYFTDFISCEGVVFLLSYLLFVN